MTPEKLSKTLGECAQRIREQFNVGPARLSDYDRARRDLVRGGGTGGAAEHVLWMALEAQNLVKTGKIEKAFRWLGFVQCFLWMTNTCSIEDLKTMSRPEEEPSAG
jgi:hypothetical protein